MLFLLLSMLSSLVIANILKLAKTKDIPFLPVMTFNYLLAAIVSFTLHISGEHDPRTGLELPLGLVNSFLYVGGFVFYFNAVRHCGISIAVSVMRLSAAIPVVAGFIYFAEDLAGLRVMGLILMAVALLKIGHFTSEKVSKKALLALVLLFVTIGISCTLGKVFEYHGGPNKNLYLTAVFVASFLITLFLSLWKESQFTTRSMLLGFLLGIPNQTSSLFLLMALKTIDSVVVFPTLSIGILSGSMICDHFIWKEKLTTEKVQLIALAAVSIILLNL